MTCASSGSDTTQVWSWDDSDGQNVKRWVMLGWLTWRKMPGDKLPWSWKLLQVRKGTQSELFWIFEMRMKCDLRSDSEDSNLHKQQAAGALTP